MIVGRDTLTTQSDRFAKSPTGRRLIGHKSTFLVIKIAKTLHGLNYTGRESQGRCSTQILFMIPITFATCLAPRSRPQIDNHPSRPCCPSTYSAPVHTLNGPPQSPPRKIPKESRPYPHEHEHEHGRHSYHHTALSHAKASKPSAAIISHLTDEWCAFTADAASHGYPDWEDCKALSLTIRTTLSAVSWRSFTQIPLRRMKVPGNSSSVAGSWFSLCCLP
jgi:hypothetical protein